MYVFTINTYSFLKNYNNEKVEAPIICFLQSIKTVLEKILDKENKKEAKNLFGKLVLGPYLLSARTESLRIIFMERTLPNMSSTSK